MIHHLSVVKIVIVGEKWHNERVVRIFLVISIILNLLFGIYFFGPKTEKEKLYTVLRVIDGDTFVIDNQQEIRLITVDAPERGFCGSEKAKKKLESLILNKKIEQESIEKNDRYGMLLALVYADGKLVNEEMAAAGWARYTSQKSSKRDEIQVAAAKAKEEKRGLWEKCVETENREHPECKIKGNIKDGGNKKIYSFPGCGTYSIVLVEKNLGDQWFCTEKEAVEAGFVKAKNCHGKVY